MQGHGPQPFEQMAEVWGRRKWLALAVFTLTAAVGVTAALSLPAIYRATATVIVEQGRTSTAMPGELESRLQLISQEILSRSRLEALITNLKLYPVLRQSAPMEAAVNQMRKDIHTESKLQPQPSGIGATIAFSISYRGPDPDVVAKVANTLASFYLEEDRKIRERQTGGAVRTLKAQLDEVKANLQEQEQALGAFQDAHTGELPQESEANLANLDRVQGELRTTTDERLRAVDRRNELLKQFDEADAAPASAGAGPNPTATRLAKKREELADLSRHYSGKYPEVIRLKEEVGALEREAAEVQPAPAAGSAAASAASRVARLRDTLRDVETEISRLKDDEGRLRAEVAERIRRLETVPRRQRGYQAITRDYQTTRDLYDSLRKRYEEAQLEEGEGGGPTSSPFRILDPAIVPNAPVAPNRLVLLFVALFGSLAMAAAAAWLADRLDTSLHTAGDIRSVTRVPVLVSIPLIVTAGDRRSRQRRVWLAAAGLLLALGVVAHGVYRVARTNESIVLMMARGRP
jgi:polysaccharide chain length determinant protein (PEP-CTERM system associated)